MKRTRHLIWIFPLVILAAVSVLYQVGGSELTRALLRKEIAKLYGVSEATVESYERRLPKDWKIGDPIELLESDPHEHSWLSGVEVIDGEGTGITLTFAHMGDGDFPGQDEPLQTSYVLVNNTVQQAKGTISFFDDDGKPLQLEIDGVVDSVFPFETKLFSTLKITTAGSGELKSGWARIHSENPIVVTSNFGAIRDDGTVITDVGVGESELGTEFTIFADTIGSNDTGVAVTNPDDDQAMNIEMTLNDAAGAMVDETVVNLPPRGHLARFLAQLFPDVENINEFEGTVVLKSTTAVAAEAGLPLSQDPAGEAPLLKFAGLTLRISGVIFTSVPMVAPPAPDAQHRRLGFPQAADGQLGDFKVSTTPVIFNNTDKPAAGTIEFFKSDGSFNEVQVDGVATSAIPFNIPPRGVFRVDTDGVGELGVGWARATMDQPLAGVVIFTIKDAQDQIVAAVGVNSALLRRNFQVIADTSQLFNTAVALAVPWEPGKGEEDAATRVNIKLRRKNGALVANTFLELFSRQHTALFLTDLFPDLEGIEEFEGWMELATSNRSDYVIALSLRSAVEKLTSVPVFQQQHAFSPSLKLEFAQRLAGTSPSLHWTLHQRNGDLAIQAVQVRIPGATLANTDLDPGVSFGFGYLKIAERAIYLSAASTEEPLGEGSSLGFDMISADSDDINLLASGTITEAEGDLVIQWQFANNPALTFVGRDTDMEIFVDPGVLTVPPGPEFEIITEFESVSLSADEVRAVRRRVRQTIDTESVEEGRAVAQQVSPYLPVGGSFVSIVGSNFGEEPLVSFPMDNGQTAELIAILEENGTLTVSVPDGIVSGPIHVDNGKGPGNAYLIRPLFAPRLEVGPPDPGPESTGEIPDAIEFRIIQDDDVYPVDMFDLLLEIEDASFLELEVDQQIGMLDDPSQPRTPFYIFVNELEEDRLLLDVARPFVEGQLEVLILRREPLLLHVIWHRGYPDVRFVDGPSALVLRLEGLGLKLPPPGEAPVPAWGKLVSSWTNSDPESRLIALAFALQEVP